jgi:Flp pilus assembly pilin Flp
MASGAWYLLTIAWIVFRSSRHYIDFMTQFKRFLSDEQGQDLIEYTLLMAFVALASASIFISAGGSISSIWGSASTQLSNAAGSAS